MLFLTAVALANPFVVLDGTRPEKDLSWLDLVKLEKCLERQEGSMVLTVQPDGRVSSIARHRGTDLEKKCLELEVGDWSLKPRKNSTSTRFMVKVNPPEGLASDDALEVALGPAPPVLRNRNPVEVGFGDVHIRGPLDKAHAMAEVRRFQHRIRHCYEKVPADPPYLVGSMTVELMVGEEGNVNTLVLLESVLLDPQIQECVENRFMRMKFVRKGKAPGRVTVPLKFVPQD